MYSSTFSIDLVIMLIIFLIILIYIFFILRNKVPYPVKSSLKLSDYYILSIILTYLVIGGYQQYFWTKKNKISDPVTIPSCFIDNYITKNDEWVYIYNFVYYFIFGLVIITLKTYKEALIIVLGGLILLSGLSIIWYLYPNIVPERIEAKNYFMKKTQTIDENTNNACPSAHVVLAMYSYYIIRKLFGNIITLIIPILISYSCLKTSQHLTIDIVFGIIYCIIVYNIILKKIFPAVFK